MHIASNVARVLCMHSYIYMHHYYYYLIDGFLYLRFFAIFFNVFAFNRFQRRIIYLNAIISHHDSHVLAVVCEAEIGRLKGIVYRPEKCVVLFVH